MDKIKKFLNRLTPREKREIELILVKLKKLDLRGLDVKKLKNIPDIYRVRKGNIRIIYAARDNKVYILAIERRSDNTYGSI